MSALTRSALTASPLADLHLIASEIGIAGFRKLRKADLIDAILMRGGDKNGDKRSEAAATKIGQRSRTTAAKTVRSTLEQEGATAPSRRNRSRRRDVDVETDAALDNGKDNGGEEIIVTGVVELRDGGTGFLRTDGEIADVYISAAQIRRCDLVDGDRVSGPMRPPRRSERHPSIVRIDTINDRSIEEITGGTPFDDLPCEFPTERFLLVAKDEAEADLTLAAIEQQTPIGRGSRVTISGGALSGKSELLRRIVSILSGQDQIDLTVALVGIRPEELSLWRQAGIDPVVCQPFGSSGDSGIRAIERALDVARRLAVRGRHCVLAIDTLDYLGARLAARALGAARNLTGSGSVTVIATCKEPQGGETTMIVLDRAASVAERRPILDREASATLRSELLVADGMATLW